MATDSRVETLFDHSILVLPGVTMDDEGVFVCIVGGGVANYSATLTINSQLGGVGVGGGVACTCMVAMQNVWPNYWLRKCSFFVCRATCYGCEQQYPLGDKKCPIWSSHHPQLQRRWRWAGVAVVPQRNDHGGVQQHTRRALVHAG